MIDKLYTLYDDMVRSGISLFDYRIGGPAAATIELNGRYAVFLDTGHIGTLAEEICIVAHEYGHCATGATHAVSSPLDLVAKHEYKADKYAVHRLIDPAALRQALADGCTEVWQLAEKFGVTEAFIRRAAYIYRCENELAPSGWPEEDG